MKLYSYKLKTANGVEDHIGIFAPASKSSYDVKVRMIPIVNSKPSRTIIHENVSDIKLIK